MFEIGMTFPDEQTDVGMASMAAFARSFRDEASSDEEKNGLLLPLGTVFIEPSEILEVTGVVESVFCGSCGRVDLHSLKSPLPVNFPVIPQAPTLKDAVERIRKSCSKEQDETKLNPLFFEDNKGVADREDPGADDLLYIEIEERKPTIASNCGHSASDISRVTIMKSDSLAMKVSLSMELLQAALNDMTGGDGFNQEAPSFEELESAQLGPSSFALPAELVEVTVTALPLGTQFFLTL